MMNYEIIKGKAIGEIQIGMGRDNVKNLIAGLQECKEILYEYSKEIVYDYNDEFQIYYDDNMKVCFILCAVPDILFFNGFKINSEISYESILEMIKNEDPNVEEDGEGFVSNQLGFGANYDYDDGGQKYITCVQVVVKDYWLNEPY